jgi:thymidylate synthase (FAD)
MNIILHEIEDSENIYNKIGLACYICTHSNIDNFKNLSNQEIKNLVKRVISKGHLSVLRHCNFTFEIQNCSRVLTHQLVRHQAGFSFSQQSLRYTKIDSENSDFYVIPETIKKSCFLSNYKSLLREIQSLYLDMIDDGIEAEDARYILPIGVKTNILFSANGESLYNFFKSRCCMRAQLEIRSMAKQIQKLMEEKFPYIFFNTGPDCKNCKEKCKKGEHIKEDKSK